MTTTDRQIGLVPWGYIKFRVNVVANILTVMQAENVRLDPDKLGELYSQLGEAGAEDVVCRAIEELAVRPKTNISAGFSLEDRTPPWRGTPKGINWPELTVTYDPALVARLHGDAASLAAFAVRCCDSLPVVHVAGCRFAARMKAMTSGRKANNDSLLSDRGDKRT